jgi:hypothetical protein
MALENDKSWEGWSQEGEGASEWDAGALVAGRSRDKRYSTRRALRGRTALVGNGHGCRRG